MHYDKIISNIFLCEFNLLTTLLNNYLSFSSKDGKVCGMYKLLAR